ncbi:MAG: DM13 domain-containing protein [Anaerolineae bacterium]|nr:DM13 domain-containing protein [Anaerolineae bacterium]
MNEQRWIAVGLGALLVLCLASSGVWLPFFVEDETPTPTATPNEDSVARIEETATPTLLFAITVTVQPTLDPVVVELMKETGLESLAVGDEPFIIMAGDFTVIDSMHRAEGAASIYQIGEVKRALRLDPFTVTSGPDLYVILSQHPEPRTGADSLQPVHVDLGPLKGLTGAQNYDIPDGTNLKVYKSVVIYSKSLNLVFSSATLEQVRG